MVFAAGLLLLFLGLGLVVPGRIPLGATRGVSARIARSAGAVLILALPMAIGMHALWGRFRWENLAQAQWAAFALSLLSGVGLLIWGFIRSAPRPIAAPKKPKEAVAFEEVTDDAPAEESKSDPMDNFAAPPPPAHSKKKPGAGASPFNFS
jgi:hypothetical protein